MRPICWILLLTASLQAQTVLHEKSSMRDGIRLAADIYLPWPGASRYPVILMRTPYGKGDGKNRDPASWAEGVNRRLRGHGMSAPVGLRRRDE